MLVQIVTENGQKKVIPLTADAGAGNPVGTIIPMYKKSSPSGYLYCDGSTFDETQYPLLYAYLGSNVLPDYREFALVGAEENTTDVYNASTNPTGTIHDHDVYTEGQAKDDQLQDHSHPLGAVSSIATGTGKAAADYTTAPLADSTLPQGTFSVRSKFRKGTVTRGKRKAVYFYIKATSGLSENAQDNVVAQLNEERSYSTEEVNTGKKWIDGKPIYRRVFTGTASNTNQAENIATISNVSSVVSVRNLQKASNAGWYENWGYARTTNEELESSAYFDIATGKLYQSHKSSIFNSQPYTIILEYTKTTD